MKFLPDSPEKTLKAAMLEDVGQTCGKIAMTSENLKSVEKLRMMSEFELNVTYCASLN